MNGTFNGRHSAKFGTSIFLYDGFRMVEHPELSMVRTDRKNPKLMPMKTTLVLPS